MEKYKKIKIPKDRSEWRELRRKGIGGSDAGAVAGVNKYVSPFTVYAQKIGLISDEIPDNEKMRQGRDLEEYVAHRFCEQEGKKVHKSNYMYQSAEYPWMLANVDRVVVGEKAGLECKTVSQLSKVNFKGCEVPDHYYIQCLHYLIVTGWDKWYLCLLKFQEEPYVFEIDASDPDVQKIMNALIEIEKEFWDDVQHRNPPVIDESASTTETLLQMYPAESSDEVMPLDDSWLEDLQNTKTKIKELEKRKTLLENKIKSEMAECLNGESLSWNVTWKVQTSNKLDVSRLRKEQPDLYLEYLNPTQSRVLRVKEKKAKHAADN